ncbi:MAG: hypothetical protein ACJ746_00220, partial [Bryobacteraceae bacterium]
ANPAAPINYGIAEAKFDRHFKNGRAMQWNIFLEKTLAKQWFVSLGYSASKSDNLQNRQSPSPAFSKFQLPLWRIGEVSTLQATV